jgi:hypothetical protein
MFNLLEIDRDVLQVQYVFADLVAELPKIQRVRLIAVVIKHGLIKMQLLAQI